MISTTFVSQIVASFSFPGVSRVRSLDLTPLSLSFGTFLYDEAFRQPAAIAPMNVRKLPSTNALIM